MTHSDNRYIMRSDRHGNVARYDEHGGALPAVGTIIGLIALALIVMNAKDIYRYIKISSM